MSKEVRLEYDDHIEDVVEKIEELLKERKLKFQKRWVEGDPAMHLRIEGEVK